MALRIPSSKESRFQLRELGTGVVCYPVMNILQLD